MEYDQLEDVNSSADENSDFVNSVEEEIGSVDFEEFSESESDVNEDSFNDETVSIINILRIKILQISARMCL